MGGHVRQTGGIGSLNLRCSSTLCCKSGGKRLATAGLAIKARANKEQMTRLFMIVISQVYGFWGFSTDYSFKVLLHAVLNGDLLVAKMVNKLLI